MDSALIEQVRQRYSLAARQAIQQEFSELTVLGACCGAEGEDGACCSTGVHQHGDPQTTGGVFGSALYPPALLATLPTISVAVSSGCGVPTEVADLTPGQVVLDLGCGGGVDAFLASGSVGAGGKVFGLEMTEQMLALANSSKRAGGYANVEFLYGYMESIPLPAGSIDVVMSNCAINLSVDKGLTLAEIARVLKRGGRLAVADVVASDELTAADRAERGGYVDCIAGSLSFAELVDGLEGAGLDGVEIRPSHEVAPQIYAASISASKNLG